MSEKLIQLQAKILALDDALSVLKKGFDKDQIDLATFLRYVRQLSSKQCKQQQKINKLLQGGQTRPMMQGQPMPMGMPPQGY